MAVWKPENIILTQKGREILSKVQAGVGALTVTKVVSGAGRVAASQLYQQTAVTTEKQTFSIIEKKTAENGSILDIQVNNTNLAAAYTLNQIGVYVRHTDSPSEVLYIIAQCEESGGDVMPLPSDTPVTYNYSLYIEHGNNSALTVTVDPAASVPLGTFNVLKGTVEGHTTTLSQHTTTLTQHTNTLTQHGKDISANAQNISKNAQSIAGLENSKANAQDLTITGNPVINARALFDSVRLLKVLGSNNQPGAGDPSPTNIRPISGVGLYDAKATANGSETWSYSPGGSAVESGYAYMYSTLLPKTALNKCPVMLTFNKLRFEQRTVYKATSEFVGQMENSNKFLNVSFAVSTLVKYGAISGDGSTYPAAAKAFFAANPTDVYYQSTTYPTATQVYCGLSITDANGYHGYAAGPTAPLYDGDKLTWSGGSTVTINRKNGICVMDGTTNGKKFGAVGSTFAYGPTISPSTGREGSACSHFKTLLQDTNWGNFYITGVNLDSTVLGLVGAPYTTIEQLNTFVHAQYNAGTPIKLLYKLATPTTETVPISEPIHNVGGSVTLSADGNLEVVFSGAASHAALEMHKADQNNPHGVTKKQVGLENVPNVATNDQTPTFSASATLTNITSSEKLSVILSKIQKLFTDVIAHFANKANPHGVTKAQVGLGSVDNTADSSKPVSTAQAAAIKVVQDNLNTHTGDTANPHGVTKTDVALGNVPNVTTNDQTPTYTVATTLATLSSGEKLSVAFGKLAKGVSDLITHLQTQSGNPHKVTKSEVGLGSVPNVATNDQTPTYTAAGTLTALTSGEKLSIAFGKIAKAITDFKSHVETKSGNPHSVTKADVGLGNVNNTADSSKTVLEAVTGGKGSTRTLVNNDFLSIDTTGNFASEDMKPSVFGSETADTSYINCPPGIKGAFYGYREVWKSSQIITVHLIESFPIPGRVWSTGYDINTKAWFGWQENGGLITTSRFAADAKAPKAGVADSAATATSATSAGSATYANLKTGSGAALVDTNDARLSNARRASNISMGSDGRLWISYS